MSRIQACILSLNASFFTFFCLKRKKEKCSLLHSFHVFFLSCSFVCRNNYCVKEVVIGLTMDLCGKTQYFGDVWDDTIDKCIYKKCAASCTEQDTAFTYNYETYTRQRYCCEGDYCNGYLFFLYLVLVILFSLSSCFFPLLFCFPFVLLSFSSRFAFSSVSGLYV